MKNWDLGLSKSDFRLRFELGGEVFHNIDQPVPRFLQAFDRARAIADALFAPNAKVYGVVSMQRPRVFGRLKKLGFDMSLETERWKALCHYADLDDIDEDVDVNWNWRRFDVSGNRVMRDTLIWGAITPEMPIAPRISGDVFLIGDGPVAPVLMRIYDDRGMDVMSETAAGLQKIRADFDAWILDYDRDRIDGVFGS